MFPDEFACHLFDLLGRTVKFLSLSALAALFALFALLSSQVLASVVPQSSTYTKKTSPHAHTAENTYSQVLVS